MAKAPAFQFYVRDWLADTRALTPGARGVYIDILCYLHLSDKRGTLSHTVQAWANMCGLDEGEMNVILSELDSTQTLHVTKCNGRVTLMSRRMERERKEKDKTKLRVRRHREKQDSNAPVTPMSHDSASASSSASATACTDSKESVHPKPPSPVGEKVVKKSQSRTPAQGIADAFKLAFDQQYPDAPYSITKADMIQLTALVKRTPKLTPERFIEVVSSYWGGEYCPRSSKSIKSAAVDWSTLVSQMKDKTQPTKHTQTAPPNAARAEPRKYAHLTGGTSDG